MITFLLGFWCFRRLNYTKKRGVIVFYLLKTLKPLRNSIFQNIKVVIYFTLRLGKGRTKNEKAEESK